MNAKFLEAVVCSCEDVSVGIPCTTCHPCLHAPVAEMFQAWSVVPVSLSDADATHLVGVCAACKRAADDPLKVLQLGGVSALMSVDGRPLYSRSKLHIVQ